MAKGDNERARNSIDSIENYNNGAIDNLRQGLTGQNSMFLNNYNAANARQWQDYGDIMGQYDEFAKTGGYSDEDKSNLRARAVAPIRSAYAGANREVDRNLARQGGFVPGFNAAKAKLARESSYAMSDASTNAEAALAQMINEGKRFGVSGKNNLFGTTPGFTSMAGNQLLGSSGQLLGVEGLQNDLGRTIIQGRVQNAANPGKNAQAFQNVKSGFEFGKDILGGWM
jgi:hypothetical protein